MKGGVKSQNSDIRNQSKKISHQTQSFPLLPNTQGLIEQKRLPRSQIRLSSYVKRMSRRLSRWNIWDADLDLQLSQGWHVHAYVTCSVPYPHLKPSKHSRNSVWPIILKYEKIWDSNGCDFTASKYCGGQRHPEKGYYKCWRTHMSTVQQSIWLLHWKEKGLDARAGFSGLKSSQWQCITGPYEHNFVPQTLDGGFGRPPLLRNPRHTEDSSASWDDENEGQTDSGEKEQTDSGEKPCEQLLSLHLNNIKCLWRCRGFHKFHDLWTEIKPAHIIRFIWIICYTYQLPTTGLDFTKFLMTPSGKIAFIFVRKIITHDVWSHFLTWIQELGFSW